ncbi:MAG: UPF0149 family protein [Alphaproteobacteria bacterium]|nr:UPF0149 family protein [Alphaproteobacteria bacterium]
MTVDEILKAFEEAKGIPVEALRAAVENAPVIAPAIIEVMHKATGGTYLTPPQEDVLFFGLHALAAAREISAYRPLVDLLSCPEATLEWVLGDGFVDVSAQLVLSLYDGDPEPIYDLLNSEVTAGSVKWALFMALGRLVWEGLADRERFVAFLDRFDREDRAPLDDCAWEGWQDAILYLGLASFEERVRTGWTAGRIRFQNDADRGDYLQRLEQASANPDDPRNLLDDKVIRIDDPVEHLGWIAQEYETRPEPDPEDPAADIALTASELDWLAGFLVCDHVPESALSMEQLDGFFAALVSSPDLVLPSEYLPTLWGSDDGGPIYDSIEQAQYVMDLMTRHWNTVARRLDEEFPHTPFLFPAADEDRGREWAEGFMLGIELRHDAWTPLAQDTTVGPLLVALFSLAANGTEATVEVPDPEMRREFVESIPVMLLAFHRYWRAAPKQEPVRTVKIGRNDPCPCGSGLKFKKCCGAAVPPVIH